MIGIGIAWCARARSSPPWTDSVFGPGRGDPVPLLSPGARRASPEWVLLAAGFVMVASALR
jgi:hypothetical protein